LCYYFKKGGEEGFMLEDLKKECLSCEGCPLSKTRKNVVFGAGNDKASVMLIGEAPGENEDIKGEPFVGAAGKLLDELMLLAGLKREENAYIANILKCRPPFNRDPEEGEIAVCEKFLKKQIEIIKPKIIVLVGRIAAVHFLGEDFKITRQHGNGYYKNGVLYFPVYHPSAVLRDKGLEPTAKADFLHLKVLMEELLEGDK
jgi:DNA polymerase